MHTKSSCITAFSRLGIFLRQFSEETGSQSGIILPDLEELNKKHYKDFSDILEKEPFRNPWFTHENLRKALLGIASMLEAGVLQKWLQAYGIKDLAPEQIRTVGLVMAGNIPLVGFHDMMSVLVSGHRVLVKPSSKDDRLIQKIAELLSDLDPGLGSRIRFTEDILSGMDAVIATGSDNSARYFEYYFRNIPHVIRKNRNGVAVLNGKESEDELSALGEDIFTYFGMGCRNVTKLYIPEAYDLKILLGVLDNFIELYQHHKYGNNVDYYRTMYLMNREVFLDNGVLLLKEDPGFSSPVGVVFYERYSDLAYVKKELELHDRKIQCVVSSTREISGSILPGTTQQPMPWDYADGVDTLLFLTELA